jgi:hypothetical protein
MKATNKKVERLLKALAIVCKDERNELINKISEVITDDKDGYIYNFKIMVNEARTFVKGRSV